MHNGVVLMHDGADLMHENVVVKLEKSTFMLDGCPRKHDAAALIVDCGVVNDQSDAFKDKNAAVMHELCDLILVLGVSKHFCSVPNRKMMAFEDVGRRLNVP